MVWCNHCAKKVDGFRPEGGALACNKCGRISENFNFSDEVTFIKNAAGQSQASGNIVRSVQSGITSCRARRSRIAKDELMNSRDALQIGEDRDDVVNMASRLFDGIMKQLFLCFERHRISFFLVQLTHAVADVTDFRCSVFSLKLQPVEKSLRVLEMKGCFV
ncbi:hypothetical protein F2Q68_00039417 [Brassica cretica]|uniref:Uncharacterized protein n=1 Tax=Brassica cretica TaxID=69181 RepID=A0A8S9MM41_BRACR|nr:hypothetical protein F2Q68_00039417 [Brassica cretica]